MTKELDTQQQDGEAEKRISAFYLARMLLMWVVLLSTTFLKQDVLGVEAVLQLYTALSISFLLALVNVTFWDDVLKARFFLPSQLLYDLLFISYLVYITGVSESVFLFLYLVNILLAAAAYRMAGALFVAVTSGLIFALIYYANNDMGVQEWYALGWQELLFLLSALIAGQFTEEARRQKQLLEIQRADIERLELFNNRLLNSIPVGVILLDPQDRVEKMNRTAAEFLRLNPGIDSRAAYHELIPELKGVLTAWDTLSERQKLRFLFRPEGSASAHLALQVVKMPGKKKEDRHILLVQDFSKLIELERKLELESRLAATGELAAGIAHEIRNPLASISGSIELLSQHLEIQSEQDRKLLAISLREIRRLNNLITDFLEFAKPKNHEAEVVPLAELINEVAEAMLNRGAPLRIRSSIPEATFVWMNRERLKQVFFNLFLNSVEAAAGKEVSIEVVAAAEDNGNVSIQVQDDGPGVPAALAERVFDPFFTTKREGTGLGLSTVAQIVRAAAGSIQLRPARGTGGGGAEFLLSLPIAAGQQLAEAKPRKEHGKEE